jgi:hypothetical protein
MIADGMLPPLRRDRGLFADAWKGAKKVLGAPVRWGKKLAGKRKRTTIMLGGAAF